MYDNHMNHVILFSHNLGSRICQMDFPGGSAVKNLPANAGDIKYEDFIPGWKNPLEKKMATHSSIHAWEIPWTEEPGGLQSMGQQNSLT